MMYLAALERGVIKNVDDARAPLVVQLRDDALFLIVFLVEDAPQRLAPAPFTQALCALP